MSSGEILAKLRAEFLEGEIDWRAQRSGVTNGKPWALILPYVDARAVQNRLDAVLGPENWITNYTRISASSFSKDGSQEGFLCELSIRLGDEWVTKMDGSEDTDIEPLKGGISKALVRAASSWGIGRYLYDTPVTWAVFVEKNTAGSREAKIDGNYFYWVPPTVSATQLAPKEHPATMQPSVAVAKAPAPDDNNKAAFGAYVIKIGKKYKGKTISEVGRESAESFASWLVASSKKDGKPLQGDAKIIVEAVHRFYGEDQHVSTHDDLPF